MYTSFMAQWGGEGYSNRWNTAAYWCQPGSCPAPTGRLTMKCSGGELVFIDRSANPSTLTDHGCVMDPADNTKATCPSSGTLQTAGMTCQGNSEDELKLELTLHKTNVSCGAEQAYAKNILFLASQCENWADLDDLCSATKTTAGDRFVCSSKGYASCSIWPSWTCTATVGEVKVTSIGQDDPTCILKFKAPTTRRLADDNGDDAAAKAAAKAEAKAAAEREA